MASLGHVAVGMAAARYFVGPEADGKRFRAAAFAFSAVSLWPDADAVGFLVGIRYADDLGHRGASHSLVLALFVALAAFAYARRKGLPPVRTAVVTGIVAASHGILDTMTYGGGLGCALLWPFTSARFWSPFRFIPIAPIGVALLSLRGLYVMLVELVVFAPFWIYAVLPRKPKAARPS